MLKAILILSVILQPQTPSETTVSNAAALARSLKRLPLETGRFDLEATVSSVLDNAATTVILAFQDETGCAWATGDRAHCHGQLLPGDRIRITGSISSGMPVHTSAASFDSIEVLGHGAAPAPRSATIRDISSGRFDWALLSIEGLVRDVYPSETSESFAVLILTDGSELQRVNISLLGTRLCDLTSLIGRKVRIRGFPNLNNGSFRSFAGREFHCAGRGEIQTLDNAEANPFDVPSLETLLAKTVTQIATSGRIKARGLVLCTWADENALVRTECSDVFRIRCPGGRLPRRGDFIEATGFPFSDNFHITLTHVQWRPCAPLVIQAPPFADIPEFTRLTLSRNDKKARLHGCTVKVHGKVRRTPEADIGKSVILIEDDAGIISIDVSSVPAVPPSVVPGCEVEITGTYVMVAEYEDAGSPFSKATGFKVVLNRTEDIKVVANPPWWTVGRLFAVIGALLAGLVGIVAWNLALRRVATRKGRELFRAQLGQVKADLRTEERTRLAVELHDTLAQNLTGVSMELEAANDLSGDAPKPMLDHLGIAAKALKSCRDELRNCLWDLRSQALEERDMSKAVLKTLQPIVNDSRLAVRFNVPRARLSDNTAHALLRVIRELVVNAIRHGNASSVRVAGTIDGDKLLCSVTDNGCGFNPETAPGVLQGHFGLQGVQERIDEIGGTFEIASALGKGTKTTISVPIPREH